MSRVCAVFVLFLGCASLLYADPNEEALRVQRYHDRLEQVGTGPATSIWVLLRYGEELKGSIYYLNATEVGIRDEYGHRHPVLLKGLVEFTARNQKTGVKAASTNWWYRAARQWWRHVSGSTFSPWAPQEAQRFVIIDVIRRAVALSSNG
jgi:hypothetical protein